MRASALTIDQITTDPGMGPAARLEKWTRPGPNGCIEWFGLKNQDGYGACRVRINGKWTARGAHRVAYVVAYGFIPHYLQVHHKCYNRLCVNPDHLQLCTLRENIHDPDSQNVTRKNAEATSCVHGHPFDAENTYVRPTGERLCRECNRRNSRESARRKAAMIIAAATLVLMLLLVSSAGAKITRIPHRCVHKPARLLCSTHFHRDRTNRLRLAAHAPRIVYQWMAERHPTRRLSILSLWTRRQAHAKRLLRAYQHSSNPVAIITRVFGGAASQAVSVAECESGLDPNAHNPSGAAGLFQLMPTWWAGRYDPYDPLVNTKIAHGLYLSSGWASWVCQP